MPTTQAWKRLFDEGKLTPEQQAFWKEKPAEELYDLATDRDEVKNLADDPAQKAVLGRLRAAHREHTLKIRDAGLLAEHEAEARSKGRTRWEMARDAQSYPVDRVLEAAERAARRDMNDVVWFERALGDSDSGVRYWGAMGLLIRGEKAVSAASAALTKALSDSAASVSVAAGEALARFGNEAQCAAGLDILVKWANPANGNGFAAMAALNALEEVGMKARPVALRLRGLSTKDPSLPQRAVGNYLERLHTKLQKTLTG
jgi:uncharacterized sulfatase